MCKELKMIYKSSLDKFVNEFLTYFKLPYPRYTKKNSYFRLFYALCNLMTLIYIFRQLVLK